MPKAKKPAAKKRTTVKKKTTVRKTAAKKKPVKKVAAKKTAAKKPAAKKKAAATTAVRSAFNKSQIMTHIAEETELSKKEVVAVFDSLSNLIHRHVKKGGAGEFGVPGLAKIRIVRKPATKARKGINPFTGEPTVFKAKPARNVVKVRPLKGLKDMVS